MGREGSDSKRFGRIVPSIKDIDSRFLRQRKRPMRPFASHKRIQSFARGFGEIGAGAARHHPNPAADLAAARDHQWVPPGCPLETSHQFASRNIGRRSQADVLLVIKEKRPRLS